MLTRGLNNRKIIKPLVPKSACGRLQKGVVYKRFQLTGKVLKFWIGHCLLMGGGLEVAELEIMASQRTMSGLIGELTGQPFILPVMLTGHIRSY